MSFVPYSFDLFRACLARKTEPCVLVLLTALAALQCSSAAALPTSPKLENRTQGNPANNSAPTQPAQTLYISEYRVEGAHELKGIEVEEAVYPFLGPGRTAEDVEQARAALEKAYKDKGYQTVSVEIPPQQARGGVVVLQVVEGKVGRLRVHGSRYYSLDQIKKGAPSLSEGKVPNFNDVTRDIVALNQLPGRQVTPEIRAGAVPGTVDIDLKVKDSSPLHGSMELNNRHSANTTSLRLNASLSYNNLWQLGHAIGASVQIAPERLDDAKVFSGYYLARFPDVPWFSLMLQGTKQDSNVSTLGGASVAGRGEILGPLVMMTLPPGKDFYHSISMGIDYKHFIQNVVLGTGVIETPITYFPWSLGYNATWAGKGGTTELSAGINFNVRGLGSDVAEFDLNRFKSGGDYIYFRGELSRTQNLPAGFQAFGKVQGQIANQPLPTSEEFSGGGLGTVPGYLESAALGDNGVCGLLELRTPTLSKWLGEKIVNDWQFYVFGSGAVLSVNEPLPEQVSRYYLASVGVGSRIHLLQHLNGSIDASMPLIDQNLTNVPDFLLTFRVGAEF